MALIQLLFKLYQESKEMGQDISNHVNFLFTPEIFLLLARLEINSLKGNPDSPSRWKGDTGICKPFRLIKSLPSLSQDKTSSVRAMFSAFIRNLNDSERPNQTGKGIADFIAEVLQYAGLILELPADEINEGIERLINSSA